MFFNLKHTCALDLMTLLFWHGLLDYKTYFEISGVTIFQDIYHEGDVSIFSSVKLTDNILIRGITDIIHVIIIATSWH